MFSNGNFAQCIGKQRVAVGIVDPDIDDLSYPLGWSRQNDHLIAPCSREEVTGCPGSLRFDKYGQYLADTTQVYLTADRFLEVDQSCEPVLLYLQGNMVPEFLGRRGARST